MPDEPLSTVSGLYVVRVQHPNKLPFVIGNFTAPNNTSPERLQEIAQSLAGREIERHYQRHLPDNTPLPEIIDVVLGHLTFIPDDYEWRKHKG